ncbi:MAG: CHRD domain-containing protein [Steroidobacteraceae bacterium]|nr:CHRD domain-containing protein [Steroidobacteraceae bacterium]
MSWLPVLLACGAAALLASGQVRAQVPGNVRSAGPAAAGTAKAATDTAATAGAATSPALAGATGKKRYFVADISWANNTYYTPSEAKGAAEFELDVASKTLRWVLTYQDLSSPPTKITLHAPAQPGATGAAILDLSPGGPKSPARGEGKLSDAQVEYLLTGWSYALVTTRKYPQGEARGQLDRVRQATPAFQ